MIHIILHWRHSFDMLPSTMLRAGRTSLGMKRAEIEHKFDEIVVFAKGDHLC